MKTKIRLTIKRVMEPDEDAAIETAWNSMDMETRRLLRRLHEEGLLSENAYHMSGGGYLVAFTAAYGGES